MSLRDLPTRALERAARRPFGRLNASFYEWATADAVAEIVGPVIVDRVRAHLERPAAPQEGPIIDVGAGGGGIARRVAVATGRDVLAVEPSPTSFRKLEAGAGSGVSPRSGCAEALPAADDEGAALYSSCTVKHWRDLQDGLREQVRVAAPGALLLTIEIDGTNPDELRAFEHHTRIPDALGRLYAQTVGRGFNAIERTPDDLATTLADLGATDIHHDRIPGQPFWIVSAIAP